LENSKKIEKKIKEIEINIKVEPKNHPQKLTVFRAILSILK
jgi:hypothetical protein